MEKKVLIVDSDKKQIRHIASIVKASACNLGKRVTLFAAENVAGAEKILNRYDIDVMFLDIVYMDEGKDKYAGISLIKRMRETKQYSMLPIIIITDAEEVREYAYKNLLCYGFLKKGCSEDEVYCLLKTALKYTTQGEKDTQIVLRRKGILYPVMIRDILYITVGEHKLKFFLRDGVQIEIPNLTMNKFCEQYHLKSFVRCNRNMLVNRIHVKQIKLEEKYLIVKGRCERVKIGSVFIDNIIVPQNLCRVNLICGHISASHTRRSPSTSRCSGIRPPASGRYMR